MSPLQAIARSFAVIALRLSRPLQAETQARGAIGKHASILSALGLTAEEIADLLGSTPGSITELVSRARRTPGRSRSAPKRRRR